MFESCRDRHFHPPTISHATACPSAAGRDVPLEERLQPDEAGVGCDDDTGRDVPQIDVVASLALELLAEARVRKPPRKAREDAARGEDAATGEEGQRKIAGDAAKEGAEHVDAGAADRTTAVESAVRDRRRIAVWS